MFEKLRNLFASKKETSFFATHRDLLLRLGLVLLFSYLTASVFNAALLPRIMKTIVAARPVSKGDVSASGPNLKNLPNYHAVKKAVLERNVFNQTGEVPLEESDDKRDKSKLAFDLDAPCEKPSLKLTLIGLISIDGEKRSVATIKEEGYETSDIYNEGDFIIGTDNVQVAKITRNQVILNNEGRKECLTLKLGDENFLKSMASAGAGIEEITNVVLDSKYILSELGEGSAKIIQTVRLVPNTVSTGVNGFKIFAIPPGSLLDRAGFKDNDVITQVNKITMTAEQGFALYQALQDEKLIRVNVLREGTVPKTIVIKVR